MIRSQKLKYILVFVVGVFIGTAFLGADYNTSVPETKTVTKAVSNEATWKELKAVDDSIILIASQGLDQCSVGFDAASKGDVVTLNAVSGRITSLTGDLMPQVNQRIVLLSKLGY